MPLLFGAGLSLFFNHPSKLSFHPAQVKAALSVNQELITLYWSIGRQISEEMKRRGWGANVVDDLSKDLRRTFPDMKGFSPRNLRYMRTFAETYADEHFLQQAVAKIPWGHIEQLEAGLTTTELIPEVAEEK